MKLPNGDRAVIDIAKLRDYCLSPHHPYGRNKARVFRAALGLDQTRAEELRQLLFQVAATQDALPVEKDDYGQRYVIDFSLPGLSGVVKVRSGWIVLQSEDFPRLTSCYVL